MLCKIIQHHTAQGIGQQQKSHLHTAAGAHVPQDNAVLIDFELVATGSNSILCICHYRLLNRCAVLAERKLRCCLGLLLGQVHCCHHGIHRGHSRWRRGRGRYIYGRPALPNVQLSSCNVPEAHRSAHISTLIALQVRTHGSHCARGCQVLTMFN